MLFVFLEASRKGSPLAEVKYTFLCLDNDTECEDVGSASNTYVRVLSVVVLFFYLGKDLVISFFQLWKAVVPVFQLRLFVS